MFYEFNLINPQNISRFTPFPQLCPFNVHKSLIPAKRYSTNVGNNNIQLKQATVLSSLQTLMWPFKGHCFTASQGDSINLCSYGWGEGYYFMPYKYRCSPWHPCLLPTKDDICEINSKVHKLYRKIIQRAVTLQGLFLAGGSYTMFLWL